MRTSVVVVLAILLPVVGRASDANLDPSFGSFGWTAIDATPGADWGEGVAIQPDGRIVVVGSGFTVRRFTPTGSLDASFGAGGTVTTDVGGTGPAHAVALQGDGRIVVVGAGEATPGNPSFVAVRHETDGTLDTSFGVGGIVHVDVAADAFDETANAVMIQPDLRLVLVGE